MRQCPVCEMAMELGPNNRPQCPLPQEACTLQFLSLLAWSVGKTLVTIGSPVHGALRAVQRKHPRIMLRLSKDTCAADLFTDQLLLVMIAHHDLYTTKHHGRKTTYTAKAIALCELVYEDQHARSLAVVSGMATALEYARAKYEQRWTV